MQDSRSTCIASNRYYKNNNKRVIILTALLACFFPMLALAGDAPSVSAFNTNLYGLSLTPANSDVSLNYLGYLFGSVDGVLQGAGSQILGTMFGVYNTVVLSLGGIILLYTLIVSTLNTAHEGELMGKKWSAIWIPLRSALGVGLLVPKATGYSLIQIFMMWVIVQGIGAANSVWGAAVSYLQTGGVMVVRPLTGSASDNIKTSQITGFAGSVLKSLVCVAMLEDIANDHREQLINNLRINHMPVPDELYRNINLMSMLNDYINEKYRAQTDPSGSGSDKVALSVPGIKFNPFPDSVTALCGNITVPSNGSRNDFSSSGSGSFSAEQVNLIVNARLIAVAQMISDLGPVARQINNIIKRDYNARKNNQPAVIAKGQTLADFIGTEVIRGAATTYSRLVAPALSAKQTALMLNTQAEKIKADGWLMAGSYFSTITRINVNLDTDDTKIPTYMPGNLADPAFQKYISEDYVRTLLGDKSLLADYISEYSKLQKTADTAREINAIPTISLIAGLIPLNLGPFADLAIKTIDSTLKPIVSEINKFFSMVDTVAPMTRIANIGTGIIAFTELLLGTIVVGFTIAAAIASAVPFTSLGTIVTVLSNWVIPIIMPLIYTLWTFSGIMAFYIPIVPYLLFTFVSLGWFVAAIEAMVAAPLVALGLTHPEGHEAFGRAEHSVMLIVRVFLMPTLIIIGFIAGIILSYIALWLVNKGFAYVYMTSLMTPGMILFSPIVWILALVTFVGAYAMTALTIVQKSFDLLFIIPNRVLTWIGGQPIDYELHGALSEIKGGAQGALEQGGKALHKAHGQVQGKMAQQANAAGQQGQASIKGAGGGSPPADKGGSGGGIEAGPMG